MKILFLGQAPGARPGPPLGGELGEKLASLMGLSLDEFLQMDRRNVLEHYPGRAGKRDAFPMAEARNAAGRLDLASWDAVIVLGKQAARAVGVRHPAYFRPHLLRGMRLFVVPHPSGVNRWWNEQANVDQARAFLQKVRSWSFPA